MSAPAATDVLHKPRSRGLSLAVVAKTLRDFGLDRIPTISAGVTFYALLAIFPAISATVSLYGLFADVAATQKAIHGLRGIIPEGAVSVIGDELARLISAPHGSLGFAFVVSMAISLWSANAGFKALLSALTQAYEERETRGFIRFTLVSLAFTVAAVALASAAVAVSAVAPPLLEWPVLLLALFGGISLLYRYGPNRTQRAHWITPGNLLASVAWVAMSAGFSWYVAHWGSFDRTFGSLGAVAGFMTWIWLSVMVILFGAELNAAFEKAALKPDELRSETAKPAR